MRSRVQTKRALKMFFVHRTGDKRPQTEVGCRQIQRLRQVPGFQRNHAIPFGMLPVFPEGSIKARHQGNQYMRVCEPVLLSYSLHDEVIGALKT